MATTVQGCRPPAIGVADLGWTRCLEGRASSITLIQRRGWFRTHEHTVAHVMGSPVDLQPPFAGHPPESTLTVGAPRLAVVAGTPSPWSRRPWNH